jgi:hypothetical protein
MAEQHLVHCPRIDAATRHRSGYGCTPELDSPEGSEGPAIFSDRGSGGADDDWVAHWMQMLPVAAVSPLGQIGPLASCW